MMLLILARQFILSYVGFSFYVVILDIFPKSQNNTLKLIMFIRGMNYFLYAYHLCFHVDRFGVGPGK
jgi:hypothetical protein